MTEFDTDESYSSVCDDCGLTVSSASFFCKHCGESLREGSVKDCEWYPPSEET